MRWERARRSTNVEDRRRLGAGAGAGLGLGGLVLVAILALVTGADPRELLGLLGGGEPAPGPAAGEAPPPPGRDPQADFVAAVLGDTEDTWGALLAGSGAAYPAPRLVLFRGAVRSACGFASSAVGPFYCPADRQVYIDLAFFDELDRRFGAPGDFARAYVVAHEVGHHVQTVLGIPEQARARAGPGADRNELSVRQELQADCLAGVWGHHARASRGLLEPGDLEEGLGAAAAIGDDTLQRRAGGEVQPETWTHGSSEQRVRWFRRGFESGRLDACDAYGAAEP